MSISVAICLSSRHIYCEFGEKHDIEDIELKDVRCDLKGLICATKKLGFLVKSNLFWQVGPVVVVA